MIHHKKSDRVNGNERGAAIVITILALLLITVLAGALISTGKVSSNVSLNSRQQTEAHFISESGLNHGIKLISDIVATPANYSAVLVAGDGTPNTGDELSTQPSGSTPIPGAGLTFGYGSYVVRVADDPAETDGNPNVDTNKRLMITSIGTGRDGSTVTTEAILSSSSMPAILVNGPLLITGNPAVSGAGGTIHANAQVTVSGNPCVSVSVTSTSTVSVGGSVKGPGCAGTGTTAANQPPISLPVYNIQTDFKGKADWILGSDGKVRNQAGTIQSMSGNDWFPSGGGKWTWEPGNQKWKHGDSSMQQNKTFYAVGNMELGSDFGAAGSPIAATFVAEGSITISANPYVTKYLENKYAFIAGKDLTVSGNPTSGYSSAGIHYAGDQLKLNGNPKINGVLVAANKFDTDSPGGIGNPVPLSSGRMEISGNATVHYDGGLLDERPVLVSWREIRN